MKGMDPGSWLNRVHTKVSSWQLPVRIPVPNRDNLIAMGLTALAFGLMVGVALGPALGSSSNAGATIAAGAAPAVADTAATDGAETASTGVPELGSPAGSETPSDGSLPDSDETAFVPPDDTSIDTSTDVPSDTVPDDIGNDESVTPGKKGNDDNEPPKSLPGTPLRGTVVSQGVNGRSYAVADSSGNVLALHAGTSPPLAAKVTTRIEPLANGTFGETLKWTTDGEKGETPLRGVISFIDPATGWIVISNRGASVAVDAAEPIASGVLTARLGSFVEGKVTFPVALREDPEYAGPLLLATKMEAIGDPGDFLELNGRVLSVDPKAGLMTMAPDSGGLLEDARIQLIMPGDFDPGVLEVGRTVNATADVTSSGLLLTGLSADYSRKAADDLSTAFGDLR